MDEEGTPQAPGNAECVQLTGLTPCTYYSISVRMTDVDHAQTKTSGTVSGYTSCGWFTADCALGLHAMEEESRATAVAVDYPLALEAAQPNPSRGAALIKWSVSRAEIGKPYELSLFDLAGRRVSTIAKGTAKAGQFAEKISFQSQQGRPLSNGMYFLRFRIGDQAIRRTVVLAQ